MAPAAGLRLALGGYRAAFEEAARHLDGLDFQRRLLERDASLWSGDQSAIANRLGWLTVHETMAAHLTEIEAFAAEVLQGGFTRILLLGMGGSSLAPEVMSGALPHTAGFPQLTLLDTTDPSAIRAVEQALDLESTLIIVSSKSGTTLETLSLYRYFAEKSAARGDEDDATLDTFVAITDPGTPLERQARDRGFRRVFLNPADVGGRFSALSYFGLVPAAATGVDISRLLDATADADLESAVKLGAALAALTTAGRDKVTFVASPSLCGFGAWAEQLLAESTGKQGTGIIPVDGEPLGTPEDYGEDRVFVYLQLDAEQSQDDAIRALQTAGHPVITITLATPDHLAAEFLRWEIATAAAGVLLGINPFDEPNVAEAKERTSAVLHESFRRERVPGSDGGLQDDEVVTHVSDAVRPFLNGQPAAAGLAQLLGRLARPGDYIALLAYVPRDPRCDELLTGLRVILRDRTKLATSVGYGPRYLHSTGQLFKGGPNSGIFLQFTTDSTADLPIPGECGYGFRRLYAAQAAGDLQALESRGRRVLRLNLGTEPAASLRRIIDAMKSDQAPVAGRGG